MISFINELGFSVVLFSFIIGCADVVEAFAVEVLVVVALKNNCN